MLRVLRKVTRLRQQGYYSTSSKEPPYELPEPPTNCCMSGCANCVWIEYAKELTKIYSDGGENAKKLIMERISDPSLKVFLQIELKNLAKSEST